MVHGSLRALGSGGSITGGVNTLIQAALVDTIGPEGTIAAYVDFEPFYEDDEPDPPVFDKRIAHAARDHGVLHETLRNWPGAIRSDHPDAGVVAIGPLAEWITRDHPFQYGCGEGSPFEKISESKGRILMPGAPLDTITLLHYAEHKAWIPDKRIVRYRRRMQQGWADFEEFDTGEPVHARLPENVFERIALDYLASGSGRKATVGHADSYLFEGADLVAYGIDWIERAIL